MTRMLLSTALIAVLSATAVQADSLVPGSNTATKAHDAAEAFAVAAGAYGTPGTALIDQTRTFGYASSTRRGSLVPGSDHFTDAASGSASHSVVIGQGERRLTDAPSIDGRLVPGSDGF